MAIRTFVANLNGGDAITADTDLTYRIYGSGNNYASPIHSAGSHTSDANVTVAGDVVTITTVDVGTDTVFKISSVDESGNESVLSDSLSGLNSSYQAILDQATTNGYTLPSSAQQTIQNQLVVDLKTQGIWDQMDVLYVPANDGSEQFGYLNWKDPASFALSKTGTVAWTSNVGFKPNGTTGYLNTGWDPSTNGVAHTELDSGAAMFISQESTTANGFLWGGRSLTTAAMTNLQLAANLLYIRASSNPTNIDVTAVDWTGFNHVMRDAAAPSNVHWYKDGINESGSNPTMKTGLDVNDVYIGALNDQGVGANLFADQEFGLFYMGSGMYAEVAALSSLVNAYMAAI